MNPKAEYKLAAIQPRKTHPMVLVAATGLTIFSILGSAAITGLIPTSQNQKVETSQDKTMILTLPEPGALPLIRPEPSPHINSKQVDTQRFNTKSKAQRHQTNHILSDETRLNFGPTATA